MPFAKDPGHRESDKYCSYCFKDGELCYKGTDLKEYQKLCFDAMVSKGMSRWKARFFTYLIRFAPRWKNGVKKM
jgi:hypothetical protein